MTLGRAYIEKLLEDFGGSYPLAIASYNAGPGRIRQWLRDYGDPRGREIDMVDWIEAIPFSETRLYTQRVLESLQIYRGQDTANAAAFSLAARPGAVGWPDAVGLRCARRPGLVIAGT